MNHSKQPDPAIDSYEYQLNRLRDEKDLLLNAYFPNPGSGRNRMEKLLSDYILVLEGLAFGTIENRQDIALIGCSVTVTYMEDSVTDTFAIVFPHESDPEHNRISFMSPIAEQLLLRAPGDIIPLETNVGILHVRVEQISPFEINSEMS